MADSKAKLIVRSATVADARAIAALSTKVYGKGEAFTAAQIRGLVNNFPEGQFVAEYEGKIVGQIDLADARRIAAAAEVFQEQRVIEILQGAVGQAELAADMGADIAGADAMAGRLPLGEIERLSYRYPVLDPLKLLLPQQNMAWPCSPDLPRWPARRPRP